MRSFLSAEGRVSAYFSRAIKIHKHSNLQFTLIPLNILLQQQISLSFQQKFQLPFLTKQKPTTTYIKSQQIFSILMVVRLKQYTA